jgi:hypothetical protein
MPQLLDLPQELLDMIAHELQLGPHHGYEKLQSLALVCRSLRLASQHALHAGVVIDVQKPSYVSSYHHSQSNLVLHRLFGPSKLTSRGQRLGTGQDVGLEKTLILTSLVSAAGTISYNCMSSLGNTPSNAPAPI